MVYWCSMNELPDKPVKGAKLVLDLDESNGIVYGCIDFCFVADNVWVFKDVFCLRFRKFRNGCRVEVGEGFLEGFSPFED